MRVQLPEGIATGGGTTKFRDVFLEPGTTATRLFRKNDPAANSTPWHDKPAELGIAPDGGAGNPADPRLPWTSSTQVDLDLFDIARNVVGPLSYGFSYYKIMPQIGGPTVAIERGPINAAAPPTAPAQPANSLRVASFNVENYFPVGKENDGHVITQAEYNESTDAIVKAIKDRLGAPDVVAVQEVAVFADGANALTGLAQALGNYSPYITTNNDGRGIATGFLVKDGTTATNGRLIGNTVNGPWASTSVCDLFPGKLFDRAPYALDLKKGDLSFTAMSNHFASQSHQTQCRVDEAAYVRDAAAEMQQDGKNVLVAGDLNDFEFSTPLTTLTQGNVLANLWYDVPAGQAYSYKFNGHLQTLDHILVTAGMKSRVSDVRYIHLDNDVYERIPSNGTGLSDHDPPLATFKLAEGASTSTPGDVSGIVPATLALTLGPAATFGTFVPGVTQDYSASTTATVTSTGADAALSVLDASSTATGRLVNGTYALADPLQISGEQRDVRAAADRQRPAVAADLEHADLGHQRGPRLQAAHQRLRGSAHRRILEDADVHAVDDRAVERKRRRGAARRRPSVVLRPAREPARARSGRLSGAAGGSSSTTSGSASDGSSSTAAKRSSSRSPWSLAITIVATPLPMQLVSARPSLMIRSMPTTRAMPTAIDSAEKNVPPNACSEAVSVTSPAPVMPAAPLEVSTISAHRAICSPIPIDCPAACVMNSAPSVR